MVVYTYKSSRYSSHALLLASLPSDGSGKRVLDLGCSDGFLGALLVERGFKVVGVERREGHSAHFPATVDLIEADLECGLPPVPGKFDYVICADILEHLRTPDGLLRQIKGVLTPGGIIAASLPNSGNFYFRLVVLSGRFPQQEKGLFDHTHVRFFTLDGWAELFASTGYRFDRIEPTGLPFDVRFPHHAGTAAIRMAERVSYVVARIWTRLFAYQFVVMASPVNE